MSPRVPRHARRTARGFSLVEVMVSLIVVSIGLLGIAKMQVLALSATSIASKRSLAASEASSLAASMHANRAYWASGVAPVSFTVIGTTISDGNLATAAACAGAVCSAPQLAAYDVQQWAAAVQALLPSPNSTISCTNLAGSPVSCTIQVAWSEKAVSVNTQGATGPAMLAPTYTLYVEP